MFINTSLGLGSIFVRETFTGDRKQKAELMKDRVPTSSGNRGKPGKSLKKSSMHEKILEFDKT